VTFFIAAILDTTYTPDMPKGSRKRRKREDEAQAAVRVMKMMAEKTEADSEPVMTDEMMRKAAAAFGSRGGKIGGRRRAEKLSAKRRSEIAKKAAEKRWGSKPTP
jgi:hypothetical protein